MAFLDLFKKAKFSTIKKEDAEAVKPSEVEVPEGMFEKCPACLKPVLAEKIKQNLSICPECGAMQRMGAYERIAATFDEFEEMYKTLCSANPLNFEGYEQKIIDQQKKSGLTEAVVVGKARINDIQIATAVMDSTFLMASMGSVVGEKLARIVEYAAENKLPLIIFACSGGARMHEGIYSLMQMAKVSAALTKLAAAGQLYISVLTDPTTGGVTASFAMLGDIIISEPKAVVGFAGRRVIEGTIGEKLPDDFQSAEFVLNHGFIDMVVGRREMKDTLHRILKMHLGGTK